MNLYERKWFRKILTFGIKTVLYLLAIPTIIILSIIFPFLIGFGIYIGITKINIYNKL